MKALPAWSAGGSKASLGAHNGYLRLPPRYAGRAVRRRQLYGGRRHSRVQMATAGHHLGPSDGRHRGGRRRRLSGQRRRRR